MQYNSGKITPYNLTATKQSFTTTQDPDTGVIFREYFDDGPIRLRFVSKQIGNSMVYTDEPLQAFERLHTLTDRAGNEFTDEVFEVQTERPVLNPFGFSDGYSYKMKVV